MHDDELEISLFSRRYQPAPAKPDWFDEELKRTCGVNPFGEPMVRARWGCDERTFRAGNPGAIKYPGPHSRAVGIDRWILEVWRPAEFFGRPEDWERLRYHRDDTGRRVDLLGDYPSRGMYVMVLPLCTKDGHYVPLGDEVMAFVRFNVLKPVAAHSTLSSFASLQRQQLDEQQAAYAEADEESEVFADYINTRAHEINKERVMSLPKVISVQAVRDQLRRALTNGRTQN